MANMSELMRKKVAGVPVIYLAGAAVIILGIVAYRMKPTTNPATTDNTATDAANPSGATDEANAGADYAGLSSTGTVVVAPQTTTPVDAVKETNESWGRTAATYLTTEKHHNAGDAQEAITLYLQGSPLSFDQGAMRDEAIAKLGYPPEALDTIGTVSQRPAKKQIVSLPGYHTVENSGDNSFTKIAALEYGTGNDEHTQEIAAKNTQYGNGGDILPVGTRVYVPVFTQAQYYVATKTTLTSGAIGKKFNMPSTAVEALNPGFTWPIPVGRKVRVA